jgi:hypothetical protein
MSLSSYMTGRLAEFLAQWALAVKTLPEAELIKERDALRAQCAESIGAKPEALLLRVFNQELDRRHDGELPL